MSAGLYLHVPYCRQICPYCDFNVARAKAPPWLALGEAMRHEMAARAPLLGGRGPLRSVYFGGGTPSLAPAAWLVGMLEAVRDRFGLSPDAEVTLELEPGTLDEDALAALRRAGFTRVSMGWQSTHARHLATLGRGHDAAAARAALAAARAAGFDNVSCDLMFGIPGQTEDCLAEDLAVLAHHAPAHISLYNLTYHQNTPFWRQRATGQLVPVAEEAEVQMLRQACAALAAYGYARYEVSNFARPGRRAVHNAGYWRHVPYLGIGPGAHSFVRRGWQEGWRWENVRAPAAYMRAWQMVRAADEAPPADEASEVQFAERLDCSQLMLERMLLGLRTTDGVDLAEPQLQPFATRLRGGVQHLTERGWAVLQGGRLTPTERGLRHADAAAALFA